MKLFNKNGKFKKNITDEINEKELDNIIEGKYEYDHQQLEEIKDKDEIFNNIDNGILGYQQLEEDIKILNR
jgi:hypothetical protein